MTVKTSHRITGVGVAAVTLLVMIACSNRPVCTGSMSPQEAREAQLSAAIPIEKTLPKSGIVLRLIPAGTFMMGDPMSLNEGERIGKEQHMVTLTKAFYIGKYEVTQGQWKKVMGTNPSKFKDAGDNAPVETVSWHACTNFMEKLATLEGMPEGSCRLPTEAQWEYACRAGTDTAFCYGNYLDSSMANFEGHYPCDKNSIYAESKTGEFRNTTVPVGSFKPNAWGLYDMHGNVWEWCADWYGKYKGDATDPIGAASGSYRVTRGGDWRSRAVCCRSQHRSSDIPGRTDGPVGFRVSLPAGQQ